jgi:tripartite-type tricarboxylate transporter receptor subunit TctC
MSHHSSYSRRTIVRSMAAMAATAAFSGKGLSQPQQPLRIVVGFAPGGGVDIVARLLANEIGPDLARTIVIENRPGASGQIGAQIVAKAPPNGDTLIVGSPGGFTLAPAMNPMLSYNPAQDFAPISLLVRIPSILVTRPSFEAKNMRELLDLAKNKPGGVTFGSGGVGSALHLAGELVNYMAGVKMLHVPYRGTMPGLTDAMAGHVDVMMSDVAALPHIRSGNLRALGVTAAQPPIGMEDLPLIGATIPGYEADNWYGLFAPANTPAAVIDTINKAVAKALANPAMRDKLLIGGMQPSHSMPDDFAAFLRKDAEKWRTVIKAADIRSE